MKILVTGASGQLGYDVMIEGISRKHQMVGINSKKLDITDKNAVYRYVQMVNPDAIIHCAAYTNVDKAEVEREKCWDINVNGTRYLVEAAKITQSKFIYISTDYVFDGMAKRPYVENDQPNPLNVYGDSKLQGENIVQESLGNWFIIRISWVFGKNGRNFITSMLDISKRVDVINVVNDQLGSPTYTVDVARLLLEMVTGNQYGIYHVTNEGYCSWAQFAEEIFDRAGKQIQVLPIASESYHTIAKRPLDTRLSKKKLAAAGYQLLPSWQHALHRFMDDFEYGGGY